MAKRERFNAMSLTIATLLPGLFLLILGSLFLISNSAVIAMFKSLPRSKRGAAVLFGVGALWFLYHVWHLPEADFGEYRTILLIGFALVAALSFHYVPDFLAVRGIATLILLTAAPLLGAAYMQQPAQRKFMVAFVYLCIAVAIYLAAAPYRLRDFFQWIFATRGRPRVFGGLLLAYGTLLAAVAFTY
jgi:hypothetical protein